MARTLRASASYIKFPNDASRKSYQRQLNRKGRRQDKAALATGSDVFSVVRQGVDRLAH